MVAAFLSAIPPPASGGENPGPADSGAPQPLSLVPNTVEIYGFEPTTLDPAIAYDDGSGQVIQSIYETLVTYDRDSADTFVPLLAERIPTIANGGITNNNMTYRFDIRHGITFASGDTLDADDVVFSFRRVLLINDPASPAWILYQAMNDTGIVAVDSDTVEFRLTQPFGSFISTLAYTVGSIVSKETVEANGGVVVNTPNVWMTTHADGTGPFALNEWNPTHYVRLDRNANYWNATRAARIDAATIRFDVEFETRRDDLASGQVDIISVPLANRSEITGLSLDPQTNISVTSGSPTWNVFQGAFNFAINTSRRPMMGAVPSPDNVPTDFFADPLMRRAFALAFDYDDFLENVTLGYSARQKGVVPQGMYGYNPSLPVATLDLTAARAAYNQSRWVTDTLYNPAGYPEGFNLTIAYNVGSTQREQAALLWKQGIEQLGPNIHVNTMSYEFSVYIDLALSQNYEGPGPVPLFFIGWGPDYADPDDYVTPFLRTAGPYPTGGIYPYYTGFSNASLDVLIDEAAHAPSGPDRLALYDRIQESAVNQDVYAYISEARNFHAANSSLQGWYYNPMLSGADLAGPLWALYWGVNGSTPDTAPPSVILPSNITVTAGELGWLNGTAVDNDPAFPSGALFMWSFTYNGTPQSIAGPSVSFVFWVRGNYSATLRVTDAAGNVGLRTTTVVVLAPETTAPAVLAGPDRSAIAGGAVSLSGNATDNDPLFPQGAAYGWNFSYNGSQQSLAGQNASFTFWVTGVYTITMWATDFWGNRGEDSFALTVVAPDTGPPMVNAGADRSGSVGQSIHFHGTAIDNDPAFPAGAVFTWQFGSSPAELLEGQDVNYTFYVEGIYDLTLRVTDAWGNTGTDSLRITIGPEDVQPPSFAPPAPIDAQMGEEVHFEVAATDNSPDFATEGNYSWSFTYRGAPIRLYGSHASFVFEDAGSYVVTVLVVDGTGNAAAAREFLVVVAGPDFTAPVVSATAAPSNVAVGQPVTFQATAIDEGRALTDDSMFSWSFEYGGANRTLLGARSVYVFGVAGVYVVHLRVVDAAGNVGTSNVTVTVSDVTVTPPPGILPGPEAAASVVALAAAGAVLAGRRRR